MRPRDRDPTQPEPVSSVRPHRRRLLGPGELGLLAGIALGGVVGALLRDVVLWAWPPPPGGFPWSTFVVNVSGSRVLRFLLVGLAERFPRGRLVRAVVGTGVMGAYTTFSTFVVEAAQLVRSGHAATAVVYLVASLTAGLVAVVVGVAAARLAAGIGRPRWEEA